MATAITSAAQSAEKPKSYFSTHIRPMWRQWPFRLLVFLFAVEIFLPIIVFLTPVPSSVEYVIEAIVALLMMISVLYMLAHDRIPQIVLVILGITLIWTLVAFFGGQGFLATAWGWWKFFMYPFVGLYAYLLIRWPRGFSDWMLRFLLALMAFEVAVQFVQQLAGLGYIDDRAGTFGQNGVGPQNLFSWFVICLALGCWVGERRWKPVLLAVVLGLAASILNGTKFYIPSITLLGIVTLGLQLISGGKLKQVFIFALVFAMLAAAFVPIYNYFVIDIRGGNRLQDYFEPERLEQYLFSDGNGERDGKYNLGRMLSVTYGYELIRHDPTTLLFGQGLGARSRSAGLGIVGMGLENDIYTRALGTGLLTRMQEQGMVGLAIMLAFFFWLMWRLYRDTKAHNDLGLRSLEFGLIIFTFFWPLWFWYNNPWIYGVMMILYWVSVGYVFSIIHRRQRRQQRLSNIERTNGLTSL